MPALNYCLFSYVVCLLVTFLTESNGWQTISSKEWGTLDTAIDGDVILPTDDDYASDYILWASTFDDVYPTAIIKCTSSDDVQQAYNFVLDHFEPEIDVDEQIIAVRCGSHSMIGASTTSGIVIDVSGLQTLELTDDGTALVAPGINLSTFTAWAEENDVTLPHGDCASVTFGGFLQGGGLGLTSRTFGMSADWVKSIEMVIGNGDLVTATADNDYSDLFWATLGGGGGNFGIITLYEMSIPEKTQVSPGLYVELTWDLSQDNWDAVSAGWKQFMNNDNYDNHFATYLRIQPTTYLTQEYYVGLHGFWTGEQTAGLLVLAELLSEIDITPATAKIDMNVHFEGWIESSSSSRTRYSSQCKSRWAFDELDDDFFQLLFDSVETLQAYEPLDEVLSDDDDDSYVYPTQFMFIAPGDGAIQTQASREDIAFPYRDAKYFFAMCGRWRDGYDNAESQMRSWLTETVETVEPYLSTYSFVSFPDWDLDDWQHAYFRDNYETLQDIKAKYDPDYMFRYSQSIVPSNWPTKYADNEKYRLYHQKTTVTSGDDSSSSKTTLYREWEIKQIAEARRIEENTANNKKSHWHSYFVMNGINGKNGDNLVANMTNLSLIGLVGVLLIVYGAYYCIFKKERQGYKNLDSSNNKTFEPLRRDAAIVL